MLRRKRLELFGFGPHLMIDGYHADPSKLGDESLVLEVLRRLPGQMDMTAVLPPQVFYNSGLRPQDAGLSGVVVVAESHIAIHTFPERGFVSLDVFSGKDFDSQTALAALVEVFEVGRYDTHLTNRGKEFPRDPDAVRRIVAGEREYLEARIG
jgi:S-adenosylmethionine decarboxylase